MKVLLLILTLQSPSEWKSIKEMSGYVSGVPMNTSAMKIARSGDVIKLLFRVEFPNGAPWEMLRENVPVGFDVSSISRIEGGLKLDCKSLKIKPEKNSARVYQFNGNSYKSKEPPFAIQSGNVFAQYFCEQGTAPTTAPTLRKTIPGKSTIPK